MFCTFVPSKTTSCGNRPPNLQGQIEQRKRRVLRACERCRYHRIRCEDRVPCSQCIAARARCRKQRAEGHLITSSATRVATPVLDISLLNSRIRTAQERLSQHPSHRVRSLTGVRTSQNPSLSNSNGEISNGSWTNDSTAHQACPSGIIASEAYGADKLITPETTPTSSRLEKSRPTGTSSFIEFATKALHQHPRDPLFIDYATPISVYHTSSLESNVPPVTELSREELDCLLNLYWHVLDVDMPFLDRVAFETQYDAFWSTNGHQHDFAPLLDAVTALASQYAHGSDMVARIPRLGRLRCSYHGDVALAAFCYLRRSRTTIEQTGTMADPTLTAVQTYAFIIIYLLNAGQFETAYIMTGLAIRIACALGLQTTDYSAMHTDESADAERNRQLWGTLVWLDLRCCLELERPIAACCSVVPILRASYNDVRGQAHNLYQLCHLKLTAAMIKVQQELQHCTAGDEVFGVVKGDRYPELFEVALTPLLEWRTEARCIEAFDSLRLNTDPSAKAKSGFSTQPRWLQRLSTIISFRYHDYLHRFYRPFISSSSSSELIEDGQSHAIQFARKCMDHAMTVTDIIHEALQASDLFYGCFELYIVQWNAVLSLIAFVLAHPNSLDMKTATEKLDMAMLVFEMGEHRHAVARRACFLTKRLRRCVVGFAGPSEAAAAAEEEEQRIPSCGSPCLQRHSRDTEHPSSFENPSAWAEATDREIESWFRDLDTSSWGNQVYGFEALLSGDHYDTMEPTGYLQSPA